jgi:2-methylisocitrate lyase-like PEP mutase family enzyme
VQTDADAVAGRRRALRDLLARPGLHIAPGVADSFHARLAERAGFDLVFLTGAGLANTLVGVPDLGLTTLTETVEASRRIARAVSVPLLADADTGYGNHLNVVRAVSELEAAGVAGLTLEDQVAPKRCGHFEGKRVVPTREMVEKLVAARIARRDAGLVLVARTDALAVEGLDSALERANAYVSAGADAVFVEAPRTIEELEAIPPAVPAPCVVNVVEGGVTPQRPASELERLGFRVAIYANLALRVAGRAVEEAFRTLRREGSSAALVEGMLGWDERQELVGLSHWRALDEQVAAAADELAAAARRD